MCVKMPLSGLTKNKIDDFHIRGCTFITLDNQSQIPRQIWVKSSYFDSDFIML